MTDGRTTPRTSRLEWPYSLEEIRYNAPLRARMPSVDIDTIIFESGSWEVSPDQGNRLSVIAGSINRGIETNPSEVFLIEGHTDAVGNEVDNLSLSDRRAEAVALILTEQFQVPPENLTTQAATTDLRVHPLGARSCGRCVGFSVTVLIPVCNAIGCIVSHALVGGLHHHYARI